MPLPLFATHELLVQSPGKKIVHGSPVDDWSSPVERTIGGCWVESTPSVAADRETTFRRDTTKSGFDVLIPGDAEPPTATDRVGIHLASGWFRVEGEARPVPSSTGDLDHWFCYVEKWRVH